MTEHIQLNWSTPMDPTSYRAATQTKRFRGRGGRRAGRGRSATVRNGSIDSAVHSDATQLVGFTPTPLLSMGRTTNLTRVASSATSQGNTK
ncbi:hypothetical protein B0H10DRAFT_212626 [Mycena sp. CBHHK59/15]|nr:hypothetical protein B0H10DRAFT_212626 [Mycena sp. CBHHK59/15]